MTSFDGGDQFFDHRSVIRWGDVIQIFLSMQLDQNVNN
ncbi:hypothetical protein MICA_375 [Micavibrio aeruginosavorus ARL-13]|uniref:Uncharacterized protein n=1 Tax=Micavibrio aeruginosavorus (strain ARL-13) TaxID=856793 RepID=G2KR68_MICAA|nr:hypothetical protein MICA_375 [Micavibrio aeruginosavorus ARL-13]